MAREKWKQIKGYEDMYMVSDRGRVLSLDRRANTYQGTRYVQGRVLNQTDNGSGYLIVGLNKNGKTKNHYVHRLVADHFVENPENKPQVNHIDYNRKNNMVKNLEWTTARENTMHSSVNFKRIHYVSRKGDMHHITVSVGRAKPYRVIIRKQERAFLTLDEAIVYRDKVLKEGALV